MKSKKIISGLLALSFVFGGTAILGAVANNSVVASAATSATEVLTYGDFEYTILNDGTVEIAKYIGSDTEAEIPAEIDGAAVTSIGQHAFYAFYGCSSEEDEQEVKNRTITSIVIPDSVIEINKSAFEGCRNLESITLPKNLKYIGMYAFLGCEEIKSFVIPDSVEEIDHGAFACCVSLESIALPKDLKCINDEVFSYCLTIKNIDIPDSVEEIGYGAFDSCESLESITLPNNLKYIGMCAFLGCEEIKSFVIPDSVEEIDNGAFKYCSNLRNITLPKNLKKIDGYVFWNCESLEGITFPEGVEEIGDNAFSCCHSFENFVIPDSVKIIGEQAFSNCHNLKSITVPASVTEIDKEAFSDEDTRVDRYKPSKNLVINCFKDSAAHKYALENCNSFKVVDADDSKTKYPELIKEEYNATYRQFRLNWTAVEGAEQYGIAVKLAGKWKVQAYTDADTTEFTSPKLTSGQSYQAIICAKVNGKWDTSALNSRAFSLTVR